MRKPPSNTTPGDLNPLIWLIAEIEVEKYLQEINNKQPSGEKLGKDQNASGNLRAL